MDSKKLREELRKLLGEAAFGEELSQLTDRAMAAVKDHVDYVIGRDGRRLLR